jgi:phage terminase large subunit-like protein
VVRVSGGDQGSDSRALPGSRALGVGAPGPASPRDSHQKGKAETRGSRNIRWIQDHCCIPEGKFIGQPVKLRPWQKRIIRGIYDQPTRRAIISFGRKNGKTALSAFLLLLHLCGPEARANSQLYSAAQSRDQAALLFGLAAKTVRMSPDLNPYVVVRDTAKQLFCPELGTLYRALSAEASTACADIMRRAKP